MSTFGQIARGAFGVLGDSGINGSVAVAAAALVVVLTIVVVFVMVLRSNGSASKTAHGLGYDAQRGPLGQPQNDPDAAWGGRPSTPAEAAPWGAQPRANPASGWGAAPDLASNGAQGGQFGQMGQARLPPTQGRAAAGARRARTAGMPPPRSRMPRRGARRSVEPAPAGTRRIRRAGLPHPRGTPPQLRRPACLPPVAGARLPALPRQAPALRRGARRRPILRRGTQAQARMRPPGAANPPPLRRPPPVGGAPLRPTRRNMGAPWAAAAARARARACPSAPLAGDHGGYDANAYAPPRISASDRTRSRGRAGGPQRLGVIVVRQGKEPGRVFEIRSDRMTIGRSRDSDIFLEDLAVSRLHTTVGRDNAGNYIIRDENSANGTYVNNQRITEQPLEEGDEIQVGQSVLAFMKQ